MVESDDDLRDDPLLTWAADAMAVSRGADAEPSSASGPRRALVDRLTAGPRPVEVVEPIRPRVRWGALAIGAFAALAAALVLAWSQRRPTIETPAPMAHYTLELGGAARQLGGGATRVDASVRVVRAGDLLVLRLTPERAQPAPIVHVRRRDASTREAIEPTVEQLPGGVVVVRAVVGRGLPLPLGVTHLDVLLGDESCAWDHVQPGCQQLSAAVEVVP